MLKQMFSVLDTKSGVFSNPFCSVNFSTALRDFSRAASDPNSDINHFPSDYSLMHVGQFDDATGIITPLVSPESLGVATQFLNKE